MRIKVLSVSLVLLTITTSILAQGADTLMSFQKAKARMMNKNLSLVAAYYDIDISEAQVIQAKVWNNPYFIWNQELYNVEKNQYLNYKNQYLVQVEQIFSIAGKHTNTVKLAKINLEISKVQLRDVIRSLLYDLGTTYNSLASLQEKEKLFATVSASYEQLLRAVRAQLRVGAISQAEAIRLESEYIVVKAQAVQNYNQKEEVLSNLRVLLQIPNDTLIYATQTSPIFSPRFQVDSLILQALASRPDLEASKLNLVYQDRNLRLQRSLSVPDIKIGFQPQDKGSNYTRPYSGINIEFPLPLFDRNQGRIKVAEHQLTQSNYELLLQKNKISNQVIAAFRQYQRSNEGLSNYSPEFLDKLVDFNKNTNQNFQKRIISLLEFIDQQRIFIQTNIQLIDLRRQYLDSINELNFSIGQQLIDY